MTWFHFCTANHDAIGQSTLNDMYDWFKAGLMELGHKVTISNQHIEPSAINIFWEHFNEENAKFLSNLNITYGIIATEIPDGLSFNWRQEDFWKERFDAFKFAAKKASFIWTMVESTIPFYELFCPTAYINFGFSKHLIPSYIKKTPQFDFCFYGLVTPYRKIIIEKIRKHAHVEWPNKFLSLKEVHGLISESKIGINFKQSENWPIPSPTRLGRLLMAQRGIAAEYVPVSTKQGEIASICPKTEDFITYTLQQLDNWKFKAEKKFEQYQSQMPMKLIIEEAIDKTCLKLKPSVQDDFDINITKIYPNPRLIKSIKLYNIIEWKKEFYAIKQSLGPIDIRFEPRSLFIISNNLDNLEKKILSFTKIENLAEIAKKNLVILINKFRNSLNI